MARFKEGQRVKFTENWKSYKRGDVAWILSPDHEGVCSVVPELGSLDSTFVSITMLKRAPEKQLC